MAEALSEEEAWRLFNQVLEALVHMGSMGIVGLLVPRQIFVIDPLHLYSYTEISS